MFTRRHYEYIAREFARNLTNWTLADAERERQTIVDMAHQFADRFKADNPRFNRETFLKACGVD